MQDQRASQTRNLPNLMPDSQNNPQVEQAMQCAICGTKYSDCNPITNGICGYCEADRRNALRRQGIDPDQPLLSQQHAPSKEVEESGALLFRKWCGNSYEWDALPDLESQRWNRLATELTKEREEERANSETRVHVAKMDCKLIRDERDSLKRQLAEANEKLSQAECDLLPHYAAIKAGDKIVEGLRTQNIALSAVVEKMKRGLESIVHECGINPAGGYYIIAHAATQLLADLGHK